MALSSEAPVGVLLASAARTATAYSDAQTNDAQYKGVVIFFDCTADPASASHTPSIEVYNPGSNEWETWLSATAKAATGETTWVIHQFTAGDVSLASNNYWDITGTDEDLAPLPAVWRLKMAAADTDSITYSVGYNYIP